MTTTPLTTQSNSAPTVTKAGEFKPRINVPFVAKHLFKPGEVAMIAGAPGLGKSTITAAIAAHAAQGRNFGGITVRNAVVVYYAAEDAYGVLCRAHPYLRDPAWKNAPFYVVHGAPNLTAEEASAKVTRYVEAKKAEHGCDQALVVFDTLNRCIGEADENSSSAMGSLVGTATRIAQETNAAVILVHHVGKGNPDTPRGSSAFHCNVDCLCILRKASDSAAGKVVLLDPEKQKNATELGPLPFKLTGLKIGEDSEGCEVTVPMALPMSPSELATAKQSASAANDNRKPTADADARRADIERVLSELAKAEPGTFFSASEIADRSGSIFNDLRGSDSLRTAVSRVLKALVKAGKAEQQKKSYRRAIATDVAADD